MAPRGIVQGQAGLCPGMCCSPSRGTGVHLKVSVPWQTPRWPRGSFETGIPRVGATGSVVVLTVARRQGLNRKRLEWLGQDAHACVVPGEISQPCASV